MSNPTEAVFKLQSYKISEFFYSDPVDEFEGVMLGFDPEGKFHEESKRFSLTLQFKAFYEKEKDQIDIITAKMVSNFIFKEKVKLDEIPEFFYVNSIAILFPYLRAFVSTITNLSNVKPMTLPIMRLDGLSQQLKDKTSIVK